MLNTRFPWSSLTPPASPPSLVFMLILGRLFHHAHTIRFASQEDVREDWYELCSQMCFILWWVWAHSERLSTQGKGPQLINSFSSSVLNHQFWIPRDLNSSALMPIKVTFLLTNMLIHINLCSAWTLWLSLMSSSYILLLWPLSISGQNFTVGTSCVFVHG